MTDVAALRKQFLLLSPHLSERTRRLWCASAARTIGFGGVTTVKKATGVSRATITRGCHDLAEVPLLDGRVRRSGGGRKKTTEKNADLLPALDALIEPTTRGDPMCPLRWVCTSTRKLAEELCRQGHRVSHHLVADLLREQGYSLQGNRKTQEGSSHPDRNAQFQHIHDTVLDFRERSQPVISVDTKKKELVGNFKNGGKEWRPKGKPVEVKVHDFMDETLGKAIPYGVYDLTRNEGWVSVGIDHDTARFAAETIKRWWGEMGKRQYPAATELLVTADGGGSNGSRSRLWKVELQKLADALGLILHVCHFPPGTSKWNKIEHRMFCHITQNWRGKPLVSHDVVVNLIGGTTTSKGLRVKAALDRRRYETGVKVSDEELAAVRLTRAAFHGDWNYTILPLGQREDA